MEKKKDIKRIGEEGQATFIIYVAMLYGVANAFKGEEMVTWETADR